MAVTLDPLAELKVAAGLQVYVLAPDALSVAELPLHIVPEFTVSEPPGFTVTVAVVTAEQVPAVPVIVYTVVDAGLAVTLDPLVELNPVPGDHAYVAAPLADNTAELPEQIVALFTIIARLETTVIVAVAVAVQPPVAVPVTV